MNKFVNLIRGALIRGLPYRRFYLACHVVGFLNTRRYWPILLHGKASKVALKLFIFLVAGLFLFGLSALIFACLFVVLSHLAPAGAIIIGVGLGIPCLILLVLIGISSIDAVIGELMTAKLQRRWRAIVQISTFKAAFKMMDLRYTEGHIMDSAGRTYGLIDPGSLDLGYFYDLFLPTQARFVNDVLWQTSLDDAQQRLFYTGEGILKCNDGKKLLMHRVYSYLKFMKGKAPAQPGFNGMWLQQGEAAASIYNQVSIEDYVTLSWYQVPCEEMADMTDFPQSYFAEVYPDEEPRYAWESKIRSYLNDRHGSYNKIFKEIYSGYPRIYRVLKDLQNKNYEFLATKELPKTPVEAADSVV